jgi:hypothetical protein
MEFDASGWSGEGAFTQVLVDALRALPGIRFVKVEDAPASRTDAAFSFISNEVFVGFVPEQTAHSTIPAFVSPRKPPRHGAPDYADEGMLILRTERVIPPCPDARIQAR